MRGSASNALPGRRMNCHIGHLDAIRLGTDPEHWAEKHVVEDAQDGDRGRGHVKLSDLAQRSPRVSAARPGARSWPSSDGQERLVHEAVGPCATGARWVRKPAAKEAGCCWPRGACPCHPRSRSHPRSVVRGRWRSLPHATIVPPSVSQCGGNRIACPVRDPALHDPCWRRQIAFVKLYQSWGRRGRRRRERYISPAARDACLPGLEVGLLSSYYLRAVISSPRGDSHTYCHVYSQH